MQESSKQREGVSSSMVEYNIFFGGSAMCDKVKQGAEEKNDLKGVAYFIDDEEF